MLQILTKDPIQLIGSLLLQSGELKKSLIETHFPVCIINDVWLPLLPELASESHPREYAPYHC